MFRQAAGPAKLAQEVEQQQNAAEDGVGSAEISEAETVCSEIVFQLCNPIFHVGPVIVVPPNLFRWRRRTGYPNSERVLGNVNQLLAYGWFGIANLLPYHDEPPRL